MSFNRKILLSLFFFVSGFCGLLYQLIWVRTAFASFGVITPVVSVVISVFMLGLSLGSWSGGKLIGALRQKTSASAIFFYGLSEFGIGLGAFVVPLLFAAGEDFLLTVSETNSAWYLGLSGICITLAILPWCFLMGTTFPFMMAYLQESDTRPERGFGFLYAANVLGALSGALLSAFVLVELLGFQNTLWLGGILNFSIAAASFGLGLKRARPAEISSVSPAQRDVCLTEGSAFAKIVLFTTGFVSLGMEVTWVRALTPIMGTQVYSFAILLFVYLLATWLGSSAHNNAVAGSAIRISVPQALALLPITAFLPAVLNDPRIHPVSFLTIGQIEFQTRILPFLASLFPFCFLLGYLTPRLIDDYSGGSPSIAGKLYAYNSVGCILGPLLAGYLLLPWLGVQFSLVAMALPCLLFSAKRFRQVGLRFGLVAVALSVVLFAISALVSHSYEVIDGVSGKLETRRDHTATTVSFGSGRNKELLVNGIGVTGMVPVTKYMAHLPLALHRGQPKSVLVICFGMGTTYRSSLSWGVQTTAVELLPSVRDAFSYYFDDAQVVLQDPKGRIVIDDGRRYLRRTRQTYDVVTIDPPPPAEAAGSSLLYSEDFYRLIRMRLRPDGILQQWFAYGETATLAAVTRSLTNSFPHVRVYRSIEGWGYHFLASSSPLEDLSPENVLAKMPSRAKQDLIEWSQTYELKSDLAQVLTNQVQVKQLLNDDTSVRITDNRPFNEYFLVRRLTLSIN